MEYARSRVERLWAGRRRLSHRGLAKLDIPNKDILWGLIQYMTPAEQRLFACDCAERALMRERDADREPNKRSLVAVEVSRRYAMGEATGEELAASWAAARAAVRAATGAAVRATAGAAAGTAAWAASGESAGAAVRATAGAAAGAAAWAASWESAWESAGEAVWEAVWEAERRWQIVHAVEMLDGAQ